MANNAIRHLVRTQILEGFHAAPIQLLGAMFFVVAPLPCLIAAAVQTAAEQGAFGPADLVFLTLGLLIVVTAALYSLAFVLGGVVPSIARRIIEEKGQMALERSLTEPVRSRLLFGYTLFGWVSLLLLILLPIAFLGWSMEGNP